MGKRTRVRRQKRKSRRKYKKSRRKYKKSRRKYKRRKYKKVQKGGKGIWAHWKPQCWNKWMPPGIGHHVGRWDGKNFSKFYDININKPDFPLDSMIATSNLQQKGGFIPIEFLDLGNNMKDALVNSYRGYRGVPKVTSNHVLEDHYLK